MNKGTDDFDWVKARHGCSPNLVFEKLKTQVEMDVNNRENTLTDAQRHRFRFEFMPGSTDFSVIVSGNNSHGKVKFSLTETGIVVFDESGVRIFIADVTISDEGVVHPQELDSWGHV